MIRYIFQILLTAALTNSVIAQSNQVSWEYNYDHVGIENGLPSSETYQVYQDKSGLLWILTDRGVVRYDGFKFKIYTTENGLCDNVNFRMVEGLDGNLWFIGYNGLLTVYKNGEMQPYRYNSVLRKNLPINKNTNILLHVKKDGSIVYSVFRKKIISVSNTGKVREMEQELVGGGACFFEFGNEILSLDNKNICRKICVFFIQSKSKHYFAGNVNTGTTTRAKKFKGHYFLMTNEKLHLSFKSRFILIPQESSVISVDVDEQFLYVGLYKKGMKKYRFNPKNGQLTLIQHYLDNYSVTSTFRDANGTLWMSTLEKGFFSISDEAFRQLSVNSTVLTDEVRLIKGNRQKIIITHHTGKWQQLYAPFLCKDAIGMLYRHDLLPFKDGFVFKKGIIDWGGWKDVHADYPMNPIYAEGSTVYGNIPGIPSLLGEVKGNSTRLIGIDYVAKSKLITSFEQFYIAPDNKIFVLCDEGIFSFKIQDSEIAAPHRAVLNKRISRMKYDPYWGLLASSNTDGIFQIDIAKGHASEFAPNCNLGQQIMAFFVDEKSRLWVASEKGLFLLVKKNGSIRVRAFRSRKLFSSTEILDLYSYQDQVYMATKFGVQKIDFLKVKEEKSENPIRMLSIHAFIKNQLLDEHKAYPAETDLIRVSLANKYLNSRNKYRYRFRKDQTWIKSDKGEITLSDPADGKYDLEVSYLTLDQGWSKPKYLFSFEVEQIIFLRWYFILMYALAVIALFYLILKLSIQSVNKKNDLFKRMMELEQMALSAQMNPHFIFNSLNSIHSFLLYEENENAEKYLLRFAKLIRQTLANSRVALITIAEEHETLKNYLLLENMRFKNAFDFQLECDFNKLPLHACIPPMLIQPYVENAIIHGLAKRTEGAELLVKFWKEDGKLNILVRDNGIGYEASKKNKRDNGHKSYGTEITEERLRSFQGKNKATYTVSISDSDESNPEFPGTAVIITIPL